MVFWLPPLLAAPFAGSFIGVVIRRLPEHRDVLIARSACESCGRALEPLDLVPLLSFLWLRGRCRYCRQPIARFHFAVEIAGVAVAALAAVADQSQGRLWADCGLGWTLLALAWIDARHMILPDVLTLPLLLAGLGVTLLLAPNSLVGNTLGAIAGYVGFRTIALLYYWLRGRHGLGEGDAKLLAAAGAWTGIAALPTIVLGAALTGIATTLLLALAGRRNIAGQMPFGPSLALAILLVRLFPAASGSGGLGIMIG